ncbi:MAG: HNH endonuclease [Acidimicrobiia bacterium]|nr:HNH endonuclease [Acidimicrobiia bacterium]
MHTCDGTVRAFLREHGHVVAKGRRRRVVDPVLRTLVELRDGGCVHPLCTRRRWVDVHHLVHWEDGGPTDPANLLCLCREHHRQHHQGEFTIEGSPVTGALTFRHRYGWLIGARPPRVGPPDPPPPPSRTWVHPYGAKSNVLGLDWTAA